VQIDPNQLPNDPAALRQMVMSLLQEVETKERRLRQLQHWVEQLLRARYGPRRERVSENQLFLFAVALVSAGREAPPHPEPPPPKVPPAQRQGHGRQRLPRRLERRRVVYDLEEAKRHCPECQEELKRIGE
jgi:transposase